MPKKFSVRVTIKDHFSSLTNPRRREVIYPLVKVVTIAVCAVVCGTDDSVVIAASPKRFAATGASKINGIGNST